MLLARARLPVVFVDSDPSLPSWEGLRLVFGGSGKMGRPRLQQNDRAVNIQTNEIRYGLLRSFSGMIPMKGLTIWRRPVPARLSSPDTQILPVRTFGPA